MEREAGGKKKRFKSKKGGTKVFRPVAEAPCGEGAACDPPWDAASQRDSAVR